MANSGLLIYVYGSDGCVSKVLEGRIPRPEARSEAV